MSSSKLRRKKKKFAKQGLAQIIDFQKEKEARANLKPEYRYFGCMEDFLNKGKALKKEYTRRKQVKSLSKRIMKIEKLLISLKNKRYGLTKLLGEA